ncbi:SdrD B-like domain protein [uncultured archaeon]|nr:SdrD B-like domain protein [uncultured archaeon]
MVKKIVWNSTLILVCIGILLTTASGVAAYNLSGYKINTLDGSGIPDWNITVTNGSMQTSTYTNIDGSYNFINLENGTYTVTEELKRGWTNITPLSREITISDQDELNVNFSNEPPQQIVSDDFSAPALNTSLWTPIKPLLDSSTFDVVGSGTKDALLSIAVPGSTRHDIWGGVIGAPRIMQKAGDTDFEIEVKFQSPMGSQSQMMGVLVQQDINKYIRFDFDSDGSKTNIIAATFADATFANRTQTIWINTRISGSPSPVPLYMRVKRAGDQWTQSFSTDGINWNTSIIFTFGMNVTSVGPFAGNSNYAAISTPPHNALIDYFFNTNSRIVPEDAPPAGSKFNISGYKINASDGTGIEGWNISLKNGTFETNTFTDINGHYNFNDLLTGIYTVTEEKRIDWINVTPFFQEIEMIYGDMSNVNFTNRPIIPTYNVSGFKINASDSTGLSGWNITIRNSTNAEKSTITGSNGFYEFSNLINGTYTVSEEMRSEWTNVTPLSMEFTISGQDISNKNFTNRGIIHKYNVSGYTINASDGKGISGWNISIKNLSMQMNTLTDTNGFYEFKNLVNDTYTVIEEADSNWTNITPASREITISGLNKQNVNFTNLPVFIVSDDFSAPALNTSLWTIINPGSESTITLVGTGTTDALLSIAVPGGTAHDILEGKNDAPRIMQKANNKDFEIEVKFQSALTSEIQIHGVIIEQDVNNYIRYSLQSDAAGTEIFAGTFANGVTTVKAYDTISGSPSPVPMYMRVKRAGNQWTLSYSSDGVTWNTGAIFTHVLKVTSIGPFVGNNGMIPPAYTGLVDYFFNNDSRISQEDIPRFKISGFINNINGSGIEGWNVTLSNSTMQISTLTDIHGQYNFGNLVNGTYTIYEEVQRGWTNFTAASRQITISDHNELNVNFTNKPPITIVSDDFSAPVLNTSLWTFSNPLGDSSYSVSGTGTKNALLSISVPGGLYNPHDIWNGQINTPRIMQNASNIDFEIEVKFQSQMNQNAQMLGVIVQQDVNKYIRFDLETNASSTRTVVATFENATFSNRIQSIKTLGRISGTPSVVPIYMRVKRAGDDWTMFYSSDGTTWNTGVTFKFVMDVRSVGPFVGNSGLPTPANTGVIDYFFNTNSPIIDEDPLKSNISGFKINANNNTGIQGWNITLSNSTMQITKSTDVKGSYNFNDLFNGTYTISEEQRPGWANTTPISRQITIMGQNITNVNFSNQPIINTYNVSGYNVNASDNQGMPGWNITIRNSNIQISKLTGPDGFYEFKYLEDGTYTIFEELQSGWTNTSTASRGLTVSGQDIYNVNFTNQKLITKYNLSGFKINASDGKGISGWNITIMNSTMQVNTVTNASGFYKFPNLLNGTYTVLEEKNPDWINVTPVSQEITITGKDEQNVNFTNKPLVIISDDFSAPELNTSLWTIFNPLGDSIVTTTGTGTRNALLSIFVPGVTEHTIWYGINNVPRVMQNASNKDFGIEVKFQSQLASDTQAQGVIIQEDMNKYIWFNFESDGTSTRIISGNFTNGSYILGAFATIGSSPSAVPLYMRVKRTGDNWTMSYSPDGITWTTGFNVKYSLKVSSVGLYVGNRGYIPPAHTGLIDYFFNTDSPLLDDLPPAGTTFNVSGYKINASDNTGIEGWNITLKNDSLETSKLTAANGYYNFTGLSSGTYTVTEETRSGWKNVTPASRKIEFIYDDLQNINFTNQPIIPTYNISGYKINASDNRGLSNWNITIKNGTMQTSKFTNSSGFYNFNNLVNGTYTVFEEIKPDWRNLTQSSQEITIQGQDVPGVNFTNQPIIHTYNVSGYKVNDNDGTGIPDWNITIRNSTNAQQSTLTDSTGSYNFMNLVNDTYTVYEENRPGWKNITSLSQQVIVSGSDRQNVNFRNKPVGIVSDDFSAPTLNTQLWTIIDQQNDSSYTMEGTGTSDAVLNISIPAGKSHDLDKTINASGILQTVSVNDFEVEVKFQSLMNRTVQSQGIVVAQDMNNFLRFDFYSANSKINVYAAYVTGGAPSNRIAPKIIGAVSNSSIPLYMRVKRSGNLWTQNYSFDGINWISSGNFTQALTVTSVGPYAGNAAGATAPAFNGMIDYFFNTASLILNEDQLKYNISGFKIDDTNASGTWDAGEQGIPDWKISLINDITGLEIANTTTDLSGHYIFHNLTNGTYNVTEESKPEYIATNRTYAVISIAGTDINNLNFTNYIPQLAPIITTQPANQAVKVGKNATFTVVAIGTKPLSYQWRKNGVNITGATNPSYTTPPTTMPDNGSTFDVAVTNPIGTTISNSSKLSVTNNIVSDDFNGAELNPSVWTFINPKNDAPYTMTGTAISITVPAGTSHDILPAGNFAPRIMQTAANSNFEIETKFLSLLTAHIQMEGMIVQQDTNNYLRFDLLRYKTSNMVMATIYNGSLTSNTIYSTVIPGNPLYLRVNRTGDNWKEFYSYDGKNWTAAANFSYPLIVSSVGPFVGNTASNPEFTGIIDYFYENSNRPPPPPPQPPTITLWYGNTRPLDKLVFPSSG